MAVVRRSLLALSASLLLLPAATAADSFAVAATRSGRIISAPLPGDTVDVIVEFRDTPLFAPAASDGVYSVELQQKGTLGGMAAETGMVTRVDSRLADPASPSLSCLRIVDGEGRATSTLFAGSRGTMRFAAIDLVFDVTRTKSPYALVANDRTVAQWRAHGSTEWHSLATRVEAEELVNSFEEMLALGHNPAGTVFAADLEPVIAAARGAIDIRLHVEDGGGNSVDFTAAPAFVVSEAKRRAASR